MKKRVLALSLVFSMTCSSLANFSLIQASPIEEATTENSLILQKGTEKTERSILFNDDWKFFLGDESGAQGKNFNDDSWRKLDLPHDWSIEFDFNYNSPATSECGYLDGGTGWYRKTFVLPKEMEGKQITIDFGGVYMNSNTYVNGEMVGNYPYGYMPFSYDISDKLVCDGKTENVIAVKVENQLQSSRWYSGSGIYRDVKLSVTDKVHVKRYGTKVTTPDIKTGSGKVNVVTTVENESTTSKNIKVRQTILDGNKETVGSSVTSDAVAIQGAGSSMVEQSLTVQNPKLWSTDTPNLYYVKTEVIDADKVIDTYETRFGFRYFEFTNNNGFYLNGKWMKLEGVCMHHDQGSLGAVANYSAIKRQMMTMKEMGANAIRVTHNPADDKLIEICEEIGLMVIDEAFDTWTGKKTYDYGRFFAQKATHPDATGNMTWGEFDIKQMVERGKNSPAIIMWSIGNEITNSNSTAGVTTAKNLVKWIKEVDKTRPTTIGEDKFRGNINTTDSNFNNNQNMIEIFNAVDVVGYNYAENRYDSHHKEKANWKMYGSETASATSSRGVYAHPDSQGKMDTSAHPDYQQSAYDNDSVSWGRTAQDALERDRDRKFIAGQFVWTGFDYIGEPTPWNQSKTTPPKSSYFGIVDTAGLEKDSYYLYQSQWTTVEENPMVHILPHWNWADAVLFAKVKGNDGKIPVRVYTNGRSVELYFKESTDTTEGLGKLVDAKKTFDVFKPYESQAGVSDNQDKEYQKSKEGKMYLEWRMDYKPGTLTAISYDKGGKEIARDVVATAKEKVAVSLLPEQNIIQADGSSVAYVEVNITDANGNLVPTADDQVTFSVSGNGKIVGVDNGNAASHERYKDTNGVWKRKAFNGKAVVLVQSTEEGGSFTLTANANGLKSDATTVYTVKETPAKDTVVGYRVKPIISMVGEAIVLPNEVEAVLGDGVSTKKVAVTWEAIPEELKNKKGQFTVTGTVANGPKIKVSVTVIGVIGIKEVKKVTAVGVVPQMPTMVDVVYSDGNLKPANVQWDPITKEQVNEVKTLSVSGTVTGTDIKAKASIRVSNEVSYTNNIATRVGTATFPKPSASYNNVEDYTTNKNNNMSSNINDGSIVRIPSWNNWTSNGFGNHKDSWVQLEFEEPQSFGKVGIHFYTDNATRKPVKVNVQTSSNGTTWTNVQNQDKLDQFGDETGDFTKEYPISFTPVSSKYVRFQMEGQASGSNFKPVGISELKVYSGSPVVGETASLSAIKVDDKNLEGFQEANTNYTLPLAYPYTLPKVEATAKDNASVFVVPALNADGATKIMVTSESGTVEKLYTIHYEKQPIRLSSVEVNVEKKTLKENESTNITTKNILEDKSILEDSAAKVEYICESTNGGEVFVVDGKVNAVAKGTVTIKASTVYNGVTKVSAPVTIIVEKATTPAQITGYEQVEVTTKPGVAPTLPEKVVAKVKGSFDREVAVTWDAIPESSYASYNTFKVKGKVASQTLQPEAMVHVIDVIATNGVATSTVRGVEPNLPATTTVYLSNGTKFADLPVKWEALTADKFNVEVNTIVTVKGTVTFEEKTYPIKANVRIAANSEKTANLYQLRNGYELPFAVASFTNDGAASSDRVEKINDGTVSFGQTDATGKNIWCNWNKTTRTSDWVGVIMADEGKVTEKYVDTISVGFFKEDNGGVQLPESYKIEYYIGPLDFDLLTAAASESPRGNIEKKADHPFNQASNWKEVSYVGTKPAPADGKPTEISFNPVKSCILRVNMTGKSGKSVGVTEVQAFGKMATTHSNYTVSNIKLDNVALAGFAADKTSYEVEVKGNKYPNITVEATNNAGVTIILGTATNKTAKVIVVAENGAVATEKVYTIKFVSKDTVNRGELEKEIAAAEAVNKDKYEEQSYKAMQTALAEAKKILGSASATQTEIDQACAKLAAARLALEEKKPVIGKAEWVQDAKGWWYKHSDGSFTKNDWEVINGSWYYFSGTGYMVTGWQQVGGTWYYLGNSGAMATGWVAVGGTWYYLNGSGAMLTDWQQIGGTWYYLGGSGAMATGWVAVGGTWYYLNTSGAMLTGWQLIGGLWYYLNTSGSMATGWQQISGRWYYLHGNGAMATGWQQLGGKWYYLSNNGKMATDWTFDGNQTYYLNPQTGEWDGRTK